MNRQYKLISGLIFSEMDRLLHRFTCVYVTNVTNDSVH